MTIRSKASNDKYREEYDRIFGKWKERHPDQPEQSKTVPDPGNPEDWVWINPSEDL